MLGRIFVKPRERDKTEQLGASKFVPYHPIPFLMLLAKSTETENSYEFIYNVQNSIVFLTLNCVLLFSCACIKVYCFRVPVSRFMGLAGRVA